MRGSIGGSVHRAQMPPRPRPPETMTAITAKGSAWPLLAATFVLLATLGLAFWFVDPLRDVAAAALDGDGGLVRSRTHALGAAGALVLLALVLAHAVIPYPAE